MRLFLAIDLHATVRDEIASLQDALRTDLARASRARISWTSAASMHLTVRFLGDTDERVIDPLHAALAHAAPELRAADIPLDRFGAFPRTAEPRVLWVGPSDDWARSADAKRVATLHTAVEQACVACGLPRDEKPFRPHLTLARIRTGERDAAKSLSAGEWWTRALTLPAIRVNALTLMKSELRSSGAVHTPLWTVGLHGADTIPRS